MLFLFTAESHWKVDISEILQGIEYFDPHWETETLSWPGQFPERKLKNLVIAWHAPCDGSNYAKKRFLQNQTFLSSLCSSESRRCQKGTNIWGGKKPPKTLNGPCVLGGHSVDFFSRGPQSLVELRSNEIPGVRAQSGLAELPFLL